MTEEKVTISIGGGIQDDGAAFIKAWHQAERGELFRERHLAFESWDALNRALTAEEKSI
jgi:hypothetical protein